MGDEAPAPARPAAALVGAVLSGAAALAMVGGAQALRPVTAHELGEDALVAWVLLAVAGIGVLFCLYLMVIWGLAALVMATGPASRIGAALLIALRALAPQVARRVVVSTALAATATGLALAPATASDRSSGYDAETPAPVAVSSELTPSDISEPDGGFDTGPGAPSPAPSADDQGTEPLPALGWGEEPGTGSPEPEDTAAEGHGADSSEDPWGSGAPVEGDPDQEPQGPQESDALPGPDGSDGAPESDGAQQTKDTPISEGAEAPKDSEGSGDPGDSNGSQSSPEDQAAGDAQGSEGSEDLGSPAGSQQPRDSNTTERTDEPGTSSSADAGSGSPAQPSSPGPGTSADPLSSPQAPNTVVVQVGDTLWSITDDLLGPATDSPSEIAAAWPLLHEANHDVIGTDPDLLEPGQELLVPTPLSSQEQR